MIVACLDLEGVIFPEIWINVAEKTGIEELRLTTRDISDYDKLMQHRLKILKEHDIKIDLIQDVISKIKPLEGADDFYYKLLEEFQVIILSDTFNQFATPLMKQLRYPTIFCHDLEISDDGYITGYKLRINDAKRQAILRFRDLNLNTIACGDSYNDTTMLKEADKGILFRPPQNVIDEFPQFPVRTDYDKLFDTFMECKKEILSS